VWVRPPFVPIEFPGFVLDWKQLEDGAWEALVTYVDKHEKVITEWLPADCLRVVPDGG
jgi:hypothetical protein